MSELTGWVEEIFETPGGIGMRLECSGTVQIQPGQYLLAYAPTLQEILPTALFLQQYNAHQLIIAPSIPPLWQPGTELKLRGPMGKGFNLAPSIQHLALVDLTPRCGLRLIQLAEGILKKGGEVALVSDIAPAILSAEIELLPLKSLAEAFTWADALAVDLPINSLTAFYQLCGFHPADPHGKAVQVLLDTPLTCGGASACGLCSVQTRHNQWKLACKDGPVFPLNSLLVEG